MRVCMYVHGSVTLTDLSLVTLLKSCLLHMHNSISDGNFYTMLQYR